MKTFHDSDFLKQLELAVQYGQPFLLEGLDEYIDPVINPVLERAFTLSAAGKRMIKLGDKEVEWDDNFRWAQGGQGPGCLFVCLLACLLRWQCCCNGMPCSGHTPHATTLLAQHSSPGSQQFTSHSPLPRRLYMTTKLSNPHYSPEVSGKTQIINYGLTQQGLEAQLLILAVRHERPDLEEAREGLVAAMSANKALLKSLEDTLLHELSNATGEQPDES